MKSIIIFLFVVLGIVQSMACDCMDPGTVSEAFEYTETIIHGCVTNMSSITFAETMEPDQVDRIRKKYKGDQQRLEYLNAKFIVKVEMEVYKVYKGQLTEDVVTIYTNIAGSACGFTRFEEGKEFIVYASSFGPESWVFRSDDFSKKLKKENTFSTNHCTRTGAYTDSEAKSLEQIIHPNLKRSQKYNWMNQGSKI